jgi:catechol 2,3-dioxygenase-like lactoylglutathione lyase family enzyme
MVDMGLSEYPVRASIGVTDIQRAAAFYEGVLGLAVEASGPSADIEEGARFYACGNGTMLNVFETPTAGSTRSTVAVWYVDDLDAIVAELTAAGAEFVRYEGFGQDAVGVGPRAGGGRIAWVEDPDGNTLAIETDN